jgi:hypothetical protein
MATINAHYYPFHWLDRIVEIELNPAKTDVKQLSVSALDKISEHLQIELAAIVSCLKSQIFSMFQNDQLKAIAGHYDRAVRLLQKQAAENLNQYPRKGSLRRTGELILKGLHDLSRSLHSRCPDQLPSDPQPHKHKPYVNPALLDKVACALSADQLGILLRAATDVGIIIGRSFRKICAAVAPFLSTPWKKDLKADTLRSHATRPEFRDKEIAIEFLERMIEKIRGYR